MTKIKRSLVQHWLNTGTLLAPVWSRIGSGVTTGKITYGPKSTEETYIDQDSASISLDSYAPNMPVEAQALTGDAIFTFVDNLRRTRAVLSDAETEVVNVWAYKTPAGGYYRAEKQSVAIQIDDFGGDGGTATKISFTLNYLGDPVLGIFKPSGTPTWEAQPVNTVLDTMTLSGLTLSPLFATNKRNLIYTASCANGVTETDMTSTCLTPGAVIVQKDNAGDPVAQGSPASLSVGLNHLTIQVTADTEVSTYRIDVTRASAA